MDDRDMYYSGYNYGGFTPLNQMPNQMPSMMPNQMTVNPNQMPMTMSNNTYASSQFNDMTERISRLERQVKRLDQRLTRIETPYANMNNLNSEPDNDMYMM